MNFSNNKTDIERRAESLKEAPVSYREYLIYRKGKRMGHIRVGLDKWADKYLEQLTKSGAVLKEINP